MEEIIGGQIGKQIDLCKVNSRGHPYHPKFEVFNIIDEKIEKISCGGEHTAALTKDGKLYLWGDDSYGQLGHNKKLQDIYNNYNKCYKLVPNLIEGEPRIGNVSDVILGTSITFIISNKN